MNLRALVWVAVGACLGVPAPDGVFSSGDALVILRRVADVTDSQERRPPSSSYSPAPPSSRGCHAPDLRA